jgi:lipid-A-disaccharide synthase
MKRIIVDSMNEFNDFKFYILTFDSHIKLLNEILKDVNIEIISDYKKKQKIMAVSYLAITASGSVTLELSKYSTPMIVVYNTYFLTRIILKMLVKVKYASIINITYGREVVPEYIFEKFKSENILQKMRVLVNDRYARRKQINYLEKFSRKMTLSGKNPADLLIDEVIN